ncbi:MAG: type II toxin-antitoxin system VapC family toxin [Gammaproteobacteria bacterium]|nr:type II toxin-antitoxin system VapC family toxin [Gammaproteobacteria bacterium]
MILYCDTSALVKLYISESHAREVKALVEEAEAVAVCRIAWAEYHAATARRAREVAADQDGMERARQSLAVDWGNYVVADVSQAVVERAGEYADAFALRGYDAVQLAAAAGVMELSGQDLTFACFDRRLNKAAGLLGMGVPFGL